MAFGGLAFLKKRPVVRQATVVVYGEGQRVHMSFFGCVNAGSVERNNARMNVIEVNVFIAGRFFPSD